MKSPKPYKQRHKQLFLRNVEFLNTDSQWTCPDCGWEPPDYDGCSYKTRKRKIPGTTIKKETGYPIFKGMGSSYNGEFTTNYWEETHWCPFCIKEFTIDNSADT